MIFSVAHFSLTAAAILLPVCVQAVAFTDDTFDGIAVGQSKELTWSGDDSPVTIKLMQGDPKALEPVVTVASGVAGGSYTWVPRTIVGGTYCLSITQGSETNYSPQFSISGASPPGAPGNKAASAAGRPTGPANKAGSSPAGRPTGPALAPSRASGAKASGHPFLPSAVIAAYRSPSDEYSGDDDNSGRYIDGSDNSTTGSSPCVEDIERYTGRYESSGAAGIGMKGMVCAAAVLVGVVLGMA